MGRRINLAYWQVIAFAVLACNSGAWIDAACLVTSTRNFAGERGTVIGILKSTLGARGHTPGPLGASLGHPQLRRSHTVQVFARGWGFFTLGIYLPLIVQSRSGHNFLA